MFKLGLGIWMTVVVFVWDAAIIFLLFCEYRKPRVYPWMNANSKITA